MIETGTDSRIRKLKLECDVRLISVQQAAVLLDWQVETLGAVSIRFGHLFAGQTIQFNSFDTYMPDLFFSFFQK